jgi:uncharacterized protein YycO
MRLFFILTILFMYGCGSPSFEDGDIIFHSSTSSQSGMLELVTKSDITHVGIIFYDESSPYVFEAVQPVRITPLNVFVSRGKDSKYIVKRFKGVLTDDKLKDMYLYGKTHLGKNYDSKFLWSDGEMYCSELVYKTYQSIGIILCDKSHFYDYDLGYENVQNVIDYRYKNDVFDNNTEVVTPVDLLNSDMLYTVYDNR